MVSAVATLSVAESQALAECESIISENASAFVKVGLALAAVRDQRLYRADFDTFEEYCKDKWKLGKSYCTQLIVAARTVAALPEPQKVAMATERHARELARVDEPRRAEVLERAKSMAESESRPILARDIRQSALEVVGGDRFQQNTEASLTKRLEAIEIEFLDMVYADGAVHDIAEFEHTLRHLFLEVEARLIRVRPQHIETLRPLMAGLERRAA